MIEGLPVPFDRRPSAVEVALRAALEDLLGGRVWIVDGEPHGRPTTLDSEPDHSQPDESESDEPAVDEAAVDEAAVDDPGIDEAAVSGLGEFRELLEAGAGHLAAVVAATAEESRQAAVKVRALAAFARCRPAELLDRPAEQVGAAAAASRTARPAVLTEVSEWAADELAATLGLSPRTAVALLADAVTLAEALPATLDALEAGRIGLAHARALADALAPLSDPRVRAEVEAGLLARAPGKTVAAVKAAAVRAVLRADASAAVARAARAVRERQVRLFTEQDGLATMTVPFPAPVGVACYTALEGYAQACWTPGDTRTKAQRMVDCLAEVILQPGLHPPVQVQLTVTAPAGTLTGGDEPGEVDGHPVPAGMVRELAHGFGLLPRPEPEAAPADSAETIEPAEPEPAEPELAASGPVAEPAPVTADVAVWAGGQFSRVAQEQAGTDLAALLGLSAATTGGVLAGAPTVALVDELSGQLLALTSGAELRRAATCGRRGCRTGRRPCTHPASCCAGLGPPPDSPGYRPGSRLDRFVRARDRRCRFPGCRARAIVCDLDHTIPWPQGPTSAANLCCLCRHHHRLSHQAPGWQLRRLPDGGLCWTLPGGATRTTYPPRYGTDDLDPPPTAGPPPAPLEPPPTPPTRTISPPLTAKERVVGRPLSPGAVDDDPAPF